MALPQTLVPPSAVREPPVTVLCPDDTYPSDRTPTMSETPPHQTACAYAVDTLRLYCREAGRVALVGGNMDLYIQEGNTAPAFAPDVLVAYGVQLTGHASYRFWLAGKPPDLVMEMASPSTWPADEKAKQAGYAQAGIREYWQYDPLGNLLPARLQGWRLRGSRYVPIPGETISEGERWPSSVLGTWWGLLTPDAVQALEPSLLPEYQALRVRLWNPRRKTWYLTYNGERNQRLRAEAERDAEVRQRLRAEVERDAEVRQRLQAEARIRRLEAQLAGNSPQE